MTYRQQLEHAARAAARPDEGPGPACRRYKLQTLVYALTRPLYTPGLHNLVYDPAIHGRTSMISTHVYERYLGSRFVENTPRRSVWLFNLVSTSQIVAELPLLNIRLHPVVTDFQLLSGHDPTLVGGHTHSNAFLDFMSKQQIRQK